MLFKRSPPPPPPPPPPLFEQSVVDAFGLPPWLDELSVMELALALGFLAFLSIITVYGRATPMKKEAVLSMSALNRVNMLKECFLAYVNAGMLEPILAISSSECDGHHLIINMAQLLGLFSWLYLLSDAFDVSDTQQAFIYWDRIAKKHKSSLPHWLRPSRQRSGEGAELRGSLLRDASLWFMLFCSLSAFFGIVGHRDVIHSHAVVILWVMLHHGSRSATAWRGTGYFHTLFSPSSALLPLQYCLNLIDPDMVGDEDGVKDLDKWRCAHPTPIKALPMASTCLHPACHCCALYHKSMIPLRSPWTPVHTAYRACAIVAAAIAGRSSRRRVVWSLQFRSTWLTLEDSHISLSS